MILGLKPFDNEEELNRFFIKNKNNRDYAIIFDKESTEEERLNYTIRTRNNNFHTERTFLDNVYDIASKGIALFVDLNGFSFTEISILCFNLQSTMSTLTADFLLYKRTLIELIRNEL